eukprot:TRINITY_DN3569_c0_g1_i1.p1 TRINITY_DN3569_c0_g1~~TRINITY_DN3569_c0_g1_i1.p1  ORF type:complete len:559 (+),score=225.29 TRINITY_DN3569_c0_g1_i1:182-1858(+)
MSSEKVLRFVHFNDVYEIESRSKEPVGGAARFATFLKSVSVEDKPLVVFSGDCFSPSILASVTRGRHMVPVMNSFGIDVSCVGNHDLDFGVPFLQKKLIKNCNFPWLMANVIDTNTGAPLAGAKETLMIERDGVKIGFVGLVESGWLETLTNLPSTTKYLDIIETGKRHINDLKQAGAQLIVAVTHSRGPNDVILADAIGDIDIILGGHDHNYYVLEANHIPILNSGSDFQQATEIHVHLRAEEIEEPPASNIEAGIYEGRRAKFVLKRYDITAEFDEDPEVKAIVDEASGDLKVRLLQPISISEVELDGRFEVVRSRESNFGNFVCDALRRWYKTDFCMLTGGNFRSNELYSAGDFTMGHILQSFPFMDPTVVIRIKGKHIWDALENGVSKVPMMEGRFPQVSGLRFKYDSRLPPGSRLLSVVVHETSGPLDPEAFYTLATKHYATTGGDGYESLTNLDAYIVGPDSGVATSTILRNYFTMTKALDAFTHTSRVNDIVKNVFRRNKSTDVPHRSGSSSSLGFPSSLKMSTTGEKPKRMLSVITTRVQDRIVDVATLA